MSGTKNRKTEDEGDCDCFAKSQIKGTCPPVHKVTHPLRYYEFTPEEIRALEECDKESFYQRCLPFSALLATLTYAGVRSGEHLINISNITREFVELHGSYLSRNPHFGATPKVILAILFGHMVGRISYLKSCDAKIRLLPADSILGNVMREYHSKDRSLQEGQTAKK